MSISQRHSAAASWRAIAELLTTHLLLLLLLYQSLIAETVDNDG